MATEPMNEEPAIEDEALKPVTTLALPPEEAMSTTISLETKRVALEFWTARRDLHTDKNSKAWKSLNEKAERLRADLEKEVAAHRGKLLLLPKRREAANLKRKATLKAKHDNMVADVVRRVTEALGADATGKKKAAAAVADLLESVPEEKAVKKKAKAKKRARTEVLEESD